MPFNEKALHFFMTYTRIHILKAKNMKQATKKHVKYKIF